MKILIVDDQASNRLLLKKMLSKSYLLVFAENGQEAVNSVFTEAPDLILMDIMMPIMDGIEATRRIRDSYTEKWMPIIILSALSDDSQVISGLSVGADDYLTKPLNQEVLYAKISTMQRSIEMQRNILVLNEKLIQYQKRNEIEQVFAKDIFDNLIKRDVLKDEAVKYWVLPSKHFSGDLIAVKRNNEGRLYFIVADSMGHGLAASLPTIIVNQVFQSMTDKLFSVSSIAKEVNLKLRTDMPNGRFVALAVGMIDNETKTMCVWNGGLPELIVVNDNRKITHGFKSRHVFSGVLKDEDFDESVETWVWAESCELISYTDGVTDVVGKDNEVFGEQRLLDVLLHAQTMEHVTALKDNVIGFMDHNQEQDDVSCLSIRCD